MAKETIQAVKQAELSASQSEKAAHIQGDDLISRAANDAKALIKEMTKETLLETQQQEEEVKEQCDLFMKEIIEKTNKEVMLLKELSKKKEKEAIELVCSQII